MMDELVYKAICEDRPTRLESFLRNGGDPNMWIEDTARISAKTFLHVCCEKGRIRCVKVLLEFGAQVDIQGSWGQTPLMLCVLVQYYDIAELLLNNCKNIINQQDSSGNTPMHIAIANDSVEGVELLLRYHADLNVMNTNGQTPLMKICSTKDSKNMHTIVKLLLKGGANIDEKDFKSHRTALQRAVLSKNIHTVELLLNCGADPNSQDSSGRTPLSNIIWDNIRTYERTHLINDDVMTIIFMLVSAGTNLNTCRYEHSNPLIMSIQFGCTPLVNYLLVSGASLHVAYFGGITPLHHAVNKKDMDTIKVLLNWTSDLRVKARMDKFNYELEFDVFHWAVNTDCPEIALLLVKAGYNASTVDYLTNPCLPPPMCFLGRPDILEELRNTVLEPPTLFDSSVRRIRKALRNNISSKADQLPLPKLLIEDVKLRGLLC